MKKYDFCPNCSIGLNSREMQLGFCQNCKHDWTDEDEFDDDDDFQCCDKCDLPDACSDFGCAIRTGVRKEPEWYYWC